MNYIPDKAKSILIISVSLLLFCANCKKKKKEIQLQYPEDPSTTTLTPRERLTGSWRIYNYLYRDTSIIENIDTLNDKKAQIEDVVFSYVFSPSFNDWVLRIYNNQFNFESTTSFNVENPTHILIIGAANRYLAKWFISPFVYDTSNFNATAKWQIVKLFDKELNLILGTDSGDYKILLKKL